MPNEALTSFIRVLEDVPRWIQELEQILETSSRRQAELIALCQPAVCEAAPSDKRDSITDLADHTTANDARPVMAGHVTDDTRPLIPHMTNSDALRFSQRKRKTASVCSAEQSGPTKLRATSKAIVFFDMDAQKSFEQLVRAIGAARNAIRKGKMSARVDSLARTGSSGSESGASECDDAWISATKFQLVTSRLSRRPRPFAPDDGAAAYNKVDVHLNEAQSLCERAAHQMLRSGDCSVEIAKAKAQLADAITVVQAELPAVRKRASKAEERQKRTEERYRAAEEAEGASHDDDTSAKSVSIIPLDASFPAESRLEVDDVEVDSDSDSESCHFNSIPLGKFTQLRTVRRAAY